MIEVTGVEPPRARREIAALPLVGSALLHLSIVALVLLNPPGPEGEAAAQAAQSASPMMPIPAYHPPERAAPPQQLQQMPPKETPLGPDSKRPEEPPREAGPERKVDPDLIDPSKQLIEAAPPKVEPASEPLPPTPAPPSDAARAKMIPGPSSSASINWPTRTSALAMAPPLQKHGDTGAAEEAAPRAAAPLSANGRVGFDPGEGTNWKPSFKEAAGKCVSIPDLGRDAAGNPVLATVQGRVFWPDHVTPMAGAHLQIVGTAFSTFSDAQGEYVLRFDPSLLQKCRIQYVQVRADGFGGQLLTLSIGQRVRSDDVVLRRK